LHKDKAIGKQYRAGEKQSPTSKFALPHLLNLRVSGVHVFRLHLQRMLHTKSNLSVNLCNATETAHG
jgi:hypothetical protein